MVCFAWELLLFTALVVAVDRLFLFGIVMFNFL